MIAVLFSGGIDSMLLAERAHREGRLGALVFIAYNQPAVGEETIAAETWAAARGYSLDRVFTEISGVKNSMAIGPGAAGLRILPGRNMIMLAHAANVAVAKGCTELWYGATAADRDYPDCSPEFVRSVNKCLKACGFALQVQAPLVQMDKREVIQEARSIGMDINAAWSCYESPTFDIPCGTCHSCKERSAAMELDR